MNLVLQQIKNNYLNLIIFINIIFSIIPGFVYVPFFISLLLLIIYFLVTYKSNYIYFIKKNLIFILILLFIIINYFLTNFNYFIELLNQNLNIDKYKFLKILNEASLVIKSIHLILLILFLKNIKFDEQNFKIYLFLLNALCILSLSVTFLVIFIGSFYSSVFFDGFLNYQYYLIENFNITFYSDAKVHYPLLGGQNSAAFITIITVIFNIHYYNKNKKLFFYNLLLIALLLLLYKSRTSIYLIYLFCFFSLFIKGTRLYSLLIFLITIFFTTFPSANYKFFNPGHKIEDISNLNLLSTENIDAYRNYGVFYDLLTITKDYKIETLDRFQNLAQNIFNEDNKSRNAKIDEILIKINLKKFKQNLYTNTADNEYLEDVFKSLVSIKNLILDLDKEDQEFYKQIYTKILNILKIIEVIKYEKYIEDNFDIGKYNYYLVAATSGRYLFYLETFENIKKSKLFNKLFGNSNLNFEYYFVDKEVNHANYDLHSVFLSVLWKWGIIGLLVLIIIIFYSLIKITNKIMSLNGSLKIKYSSLLFIGTALVLYSAIHTTLFASNLFWFYGFLIYVLIFPNVFFSEK